MSQTIFALVVISIIAIIGNRILTNKENKKKGSEIISDLHDEIVAWREHMASERIANEKKISRRR